MSSRERMSPVDTAWLRMDRPNNLMQILGVMLFDGDLDVKRLKHAIEGRMLGHRRFMQCVVEDESGYWWQDDLDFCIDSHLKHARLPGAAGKVELQEFVSGLASESLDQSRPLWEFHLVDTALGGQALVMRIHHCIADGIALVGVFLRVSPFAQRAGLDREQLLAAGVGVGHGGTEEDLVVAVVQRRIGDLGQVESLARGRRPFRRRRHFNGQLVRPGRGRSIGSPAQETARYQELYTRICA